MKLLKVIVSKLADKWDRPYLVVSNYVKARISFTITKATHYCLHGSRVKVDKISSRFPAWEDGAGLSHLYFLE